MDNVLIGYRNNIVKFAHAAKYLEIFYLSGPQNILYKKQLKIPNYDIV